MNVLPVIFANVMVGAAKCNSFTAVPQNPQRVGVTLAAGGQVSMWPDYVRIMATSQVADELERTKQSIKAKATAALGGRGELREDRA